MHVYKTRVSLQEDSQQTPLTLYKVDVAFPFKILIKKNLNFFIIQL